MTFEAYSGLSEQQRKEVRYTSGGKTYDLDHPEGLTLSMKYKGAGASGANAQGWERNSHKFFSELAKAHPEYFSKKNLQRIENHTAPIADARFAASFPQYEQYKGQGLIHHHVGRDGQAVAIPSGMHSGQGEIHRVEDALGITERAARFSGRCAEYCKKDPSYINRRSTEFVKAFKAQSTTVSAAQNTKRNAFSAVKERGPKADHSRLKPSKAAGPIKSNAFSQHAESKKNAAPSRVGSQSRGNAVSRASHASKGGASKAVRSPGKSASRSASGGTRSNSASKSR